MRMTVGTDREIFIALGTATMRGNLSIPPAALGVVVFAHGSGSSRFSPRNRFVANMLVEQSMATLLLDLLTPQEAQLDAATGSHRFDIEFLAQRVLAASVWLRNNKETAGMRQGYFGSSTGAAAALVAAAWNAEGVAAIVSRGGRPDLAGPVLSQVRVPTLLLVGGEDVEALELNRRALDQMTTEKCLGIIPEATHLFEEPGALEEVARRAAEWFEQHFRRVTSGPTGL